MLWPCPSYLTLLDEFSRSPDVRGVVGDYCVCLLLQGFGIVLVIVYIRKLVFIILCIRIVLLFHLFVYPASTVWEEILRTMRSACGNSHV
jgi:hypothetical protein